MQKTKLMMAVGTTALALSVCLYTGCRKDDDKTTTTTTSEDTGYATDQNLAEKMFDDVQVVADKGSTTTGSGEFKTSGCGTVTHSGTTYTINFGETNCLCADNRYRRGKVIVNYTGAYADSGSSHTITFDNYYQNDNKIEGTKTVSNMGKNSLGQPWFNINVNGTITKSDGTVLTTNWNRVRTWTEGYTTKLIWKDDVYKITGSGTITRPAGVVNVSIPTTTPLVISLDCRWIEAGSIVYTLPSGLTRTLNYGDSPTCDNQARLTLPGGTVKDITLP
jgi:hypothetical protein